MNTAPRNNAGWLESLRRLGQSSSALLSNRFELFTVELQEEKLRLLKLLLWLGFAATIGVAGVLVGVFALAFWLWATAGYSGLVALALAALAVAGGIIWRIRRRMQVGPTPFAQTVAEFRKDGECLRNK